MFGWWWDLCVYSIPSVVCKLINMCTRCLKKGEKMMVPDSIMLDVKIYSLCFLMVVIINLIINEMIGSLTLFWWYSCSVGFILQGDNKYTGYTLIYKCFSSCQQYLLLHGIHLPKVNYSCFLLYLQLAIKCSEDNYEGACVYEKDKLCDKWNSENPYCLLTLWCKWQCKMRKRDMVEFLH